MVTVKLLNGDCKEKLKELADNSIDSIVVDPPYGLSKEPDMIEVLTHWLAGDDYTHSSKGFMGKTWDSFVPSPSIWKECLRVLKPGGHMVSFFGTRTYDMGVLSIRIAGFEIRDQLAWVYGCLSEDTNIVTPYGEKSYTTIKAGDLVLCYDKYNKQYSYQPVEEIYEYTIKDTAYRIQSNHTDQIVSRNHRCLVERGGREVFIFAEELGTQENIPFLEDLPSLQSAISNTYQRASITKQNMFQKMLQSYDWIEKFWKRTVGTAFWYGTSSLHSLWNYILPQQKAYRTSGKPNVFPPMQWSIEGRGMEETCTQREKKLDFTIRTRISETDDWGEQSKLEGWNNLQATKRKSQGSKVYSVSKRMHGYGTEGWLHNGTSVVNGPTDRKIINPDRSSSPYQSRCIRQSDRKLNVICEQSGPQTIREWSGHKTSLATVTPFEYEGKIWCVKVPTGSFVAVRNGKAFTTGNSGFPKSMAVDKAIDKHFKAERTIKKGVKQGHEEFANRTTKGHLSGENKNEGWARPWMEADDANDYHYDFEPATEDAKKWVGWGTALKPAFEPIVLARKPIIGTVAENVLKHGVGGININDTRIPINPEIDDPRLGGKGTWKTDGMAKNVYAGGYAGIENGSSALGRFPSNFIHDGSEEVVELFPQSKGQQGDVKGTEKSHTGQNGIYNEYGRVESQKRGDSGSAARFFYCAKASKSDRNFGLDDFEEASIGAKGNGIRRVCETCGASSLESHLCKCSEKNWVNPANKKNIHPTVKPTELMKYLVKMVTPVGGTVLDPFMGSGSTGKAAVSEGFNFVGIEMQKSYYDIAEARINHAMLPKVEEPKVKKEKKPKSTPILPSALFE